MRLSINIMDMPVPQGRRRYLRNRRFTRRKLGARPRPILRTFAPIAGTSSQPFESRMIGNSLQHQAQAIAIVRRKTEFGPVRHDFREPVEGLAGQDAAFLELRLATDDR